MTTRMFWQRLRLRLPYVTHLLLSPAHQSWFCLSPGLPVSMETLETCSESACLSVTRNPIPEKNRIGRIQCLWCCIGVSILTRHRFHLKLQGLARALCKKACPKKNTHKADAEFDRAWQKKSQHWWTSHQASQPRTIQVCACHLPSSTYRFLCIVRNVLRLVRRAGR